MSFKKMQSLISNIEQFEPKFDEMETLKDKEKLFDAFRTTLLPSLQGKIEILETSKSLALKDCESLKQELNNESIQRRIAEVEAKALKVRSDSLEKYITTLQQENKRLLEWDEENKKQIKRYKQDIESRNLAAASLLTFSNDQSASDTKENKDSKDDKPSISEKQKEIERKKKLERLIKNKRESPTITKRRRNTVNSSQTEPKDFRQKSWDKVPARQSIETGNMFDFIVKG